MIHQRPQLHIPVWLHQILANTLNGGDLLTAYHLEIEVTLTKIQSFHQATWQCWPKVMPTKFMQNKWTVRNFVCLYWRKDTENWQQYPYGHQKLTKIPKMAGIRNWCKTNRKYCENSNDNSTDGMTFYKSAQPSTTVFYTHTKSWGRPGGSSDCQAGQM